MSLSYSDHRVDVQPEAHSLAVRFCIRNDSGECWRASDGYAMGWQFLDPETGAYIAEGEWAPFPEEITPGGSAEFELQIPLPAERGEYRVRVSPVHSSKGWLYQRDGEVFLIDAEVGSEGVRVRGWQATSPGALEWKAFWRAFGKAFRFPVATISGNWGLIRSMVRRDVSARYRGSFGGIFWTVLNPLLLMATYFFVFGVVLRARFEGDPSQTGFALYFLAGMLPWLGFSEPVGRSPHVVLEHRNFVKRLVFPVETLPVVQVVSGVVTQAFATAIFLVVLLAIRGFVPASVLWLPVLLVPQVLFTAGLCWFLAGLGAYVRDLGQLSGFLLTLWFFITPICYPVASLPPSLLPLLRNNPMFTLVEGYRAILLEGRHPLSPALLVFGLLAVAIFFLGHAWFYRLRRSFADVI